MRERILAIWLVILVLGFGVSSVAADGTVILHPGYIKGTVSVTGETLIGGPVDAYSIPSGFDGHSGITQDSEYLVTVEGNYQYEVTCEAHMHQSFPSGYYTGTNLFMGRKVTYVPVATSEDPYVTLDFSMDPGYIIPVVTVTGGNINYMRFTATTNYDSAEGTYYTATHDISSTGGYLDGTTSFPMKPWMSVDANNDGDYFDYELGDTYLQVRGRVGVNGIEYGLAPQYIDLAVSGSTYVYWSLNVEPGSIFGSVNVENEEVASYSVHGITYINGGFVYFNRGYSGSEAYSVEVPQATWDVYPTLSIYGEMNSYNVLQLPRKSAEVLPGEAVELNWDIVPGYVTGTINLYGAHDNLQYVKVDGQGATATNSAQAVNRTNNYRLILNEGNWRIGYPYVYLYFNHGDPYETSSFKVREYGLYPMAVTSGNTIRDVDFSYGTATVTVNFLVEGGGELQRPRLFATLTDGQFISSAESLGSNELTTLGESTITLLAGSHIVSAYATVGGSYTRFGEFTISVDPGDVIVQDIGSPTVDVTYPEGLQHICGSSVVVEGTATDDSGVATITVNGVSVEPESTNNPEDPNEVSFSTVVEGLEVGENIITIGVVDTYGKSATIERTVIRDPCNLPPKIISISGPMDPVATGASVDMFATFTDPDVDDSHSAIWDWGDGTSSAGIVDQTERTVAGSHNYATPGVYTVTLTVIDSYGESDTAVWSQYCVIYDPAAGFVTGGGWIDSPPGAYPSNPSLADKANFGFVAKYKKGTTVPTGTTEFQFKAGDLNFHSDAYEYLIIAGAKAMFKGIGTINGEGSYKFLIMAVDGNLLGAGTPDTFRIKVWTENEATGEEFIIYDNGLQGTELGGGSITIHT